MTEAEQRGLDYLFKLRQSGWVKKLILQQHCQPGWERTVDGWEALEIKYLEKTASRGTGQA
jgi:hypothetical protein